MTSAIKAQPKGQTLIPLTYGDYVKNPAYQPYIKDSMATEKLFNDRLGFVPDEETCILSSKEQYPKINGCLLWVLAAILAEAREGKIPKESDVASHRCPTSTCWNPLHLCFEDLISSFSRAGCHGSIQIHDYREL